MSKKKQQARSQLRKAADLLVGEMYQGKWDHLYDFNTLPLARAHELFRELERRCPGHSTEAYEETFLRSAWENR